VHGRLGNAERLRYLKRHGLTKRAELNTIANRTLISDETNGKIKDSAPATYVQDAGIFPAGTSDELMEPHFLGREILALMADAEEALSDEQAAILYERFVRAREQKIVAEIRAACGIEVGVPPAPTTVEMVEMAPDCLPSKRRLRTSSQSSSLRAKPCERSVCTEAPRVSFLMCPFCVRSPSSDLTTTSLDDAKPPTSGVTGRFGGYDPPGDRGSGADVLRDEASAPHSRAASPQASAARSSSA